MATDPAQQIRRSGGLPPDVSIGESWEAMVAEVRDDNRRGRIDTPGRAFVERLVDAETFTELGRIIGVSPAPGEKRTSDAPGRVAGGLVGGWGWHGDRALFVTADEVLEPGVPRHPAAAATAHNVHLEALRTGGPFIAFDAAPRNRPDLLPAVRFFDVGIQVDLDFHAIASRIVPNIVAMTGPVDAPVLLESTFAHYVVVGPGFGATTPDGLRVDGARAAELGWVDLVCASEDDVVAAVAAVLAHLPANCWSAPPAIPARDAGGTVDAAAGPSALVRSLADAGEAVELSAHASGAAVAALVRIGGRVVGIAAGAIATPADAVRLVKLRRICATFVLPLVVVELEPPDGAAPLFSSAALDSSGEAVPVLLAVAAHTSAGGHADADFALAWDAAGGTNADRVVKPRDTRATLVEALDALADGPVRAQRARARHRFRGFGSESAEFM